MSIGERLSQIRGTLTQTEFSKALQIAQTTYWRYETDDRKPDASTLEKLAEMGWSPTWILTGKGSQRINGPTESKWDDYVLVPRYAVTASMGGGQEIMSEQIVDYFAFRRQYLEFLGVSEKHAAVIRLRGDSMQGVLENRDTVMVDLASRTPMPVREGADDGVFVLRLGNSNELLAKFVAKTEGAGIRIRSSVASGLQDIIAHPDDVTILGKIVWFGRSVATPLQRR